MRLLSKHENDSPPERLARIFIRNKSEPARGNTLVSCQTSSVAEGYHTCNRDIVINLPHQAHRAGRISSPERKLRDLKRQNLMSSVRSGTIYHCQSCIRCCLKCTQCLSCVARKGLCYFKSLYTRRSRTGLRIVSALRAS